MLSRVKIDTVWKAVPHAYNSAAKTVIPDTSFASRQQQFVTMASPTVSRHKTSRKKTSAFISNRLNTSLYANNKSACMRLYSRLSIPS